MTEVLLIVVIIVQVGLALLFLKKNQKSGGEDVIAEYLKKDLDSLSKDVISMRENLSEKVSTSMEKNQTTMLASLQKQFAESSRLITEVTKNLTEIKESNKQVVSVTDELKTLQNILQNPKQRGVLGEYYLQTVLENALPPNGFSMQYAFKNGDIVDAALFLDAGKILAIDSKFSLENYNRLIEEKNPVQRDKLAQQFKNDLKKRIDETSKYIRPDEGTLDHAFMFIPSEAIYYDLLANKIGATNVAARDLIEYAFREKHVIIVSPTTFLAYLQTVIQGLRSLQIEEKARDIQKRVGLLGRHIAAYQDYMLRLGKSLSTSVNHFNHAHSELKKIDTDVVKIAETNPAVEPLLIDRPNIEE